MNLKLKNSRFASIKFTGSAQLNSLVSHHVAVFLFLKGTMCTLALYFQEFESYPLTIVANRDEFFSRPSASPQVLADNPLVFGGKDLLAGGTWLGVNEHGLLVGIVNRRSGAKKEGVKGRSRGLLCLDLLKVKDPLRAIEILRREKASDYQPFNLLFANSKEAYVAYNAGERVECVRLKKGVLVLGNDSIYSGSSGKVDFANNLFEDARRQIAEGVMDPSFFKRLFKRGIQIWDQPSLLRLFKGVLSNHRLAGSSRDPREAICVHTSSYGTVSSTVIFYSGNEKRFHYYHASGSPCRSEYERFFSVEVL